MNIFENDLQFFTNLPPGISPQKAKIAVRNALDDHVNTPDQEISYQSFSDDLDNHKNSNELLKAFLEILPIATALSEANQQERSSPKSGRK